jgi:hypothetical protein
MGGSCLNPLSGGFRDERMLVVKNYCKFTIFTPQRRKRIVGDERRAREGNLKEEESL